jgi:hypothetical protein
MLLTGCRPETLDIVAVVDRVNVKPVRFYCAVVGPEDGRDVGAAARLQGIRGHGSDAAHPNNEDACLFAGHGVLPQCFCPSFGCPTRGSIGRSKSCTHTERLFSPPSASSFSGRMAPVRSTDWLCSGWTMVDTWLRGPLCSKVSKNHSLAGDSLVCYVIGGLS